MFSRGRWNKIRLVLGDNRKEKSEIEQYIFVKSKNEEYTKIFGKNHGLETYEDTKTTYTFTCIGINKPR